MSKRIANTRDKKAARSAQKTTKHRNPEYLRARYIRRRVQTLRV